MPLNHSTNHSTHVAPTPSLDLKQTYFSKAREPLLKPLDSFPAADGPQTFVRKTSVSMDLSRERSATSRFKRLLSSSSWCNRRRSLTRGGRTFSATHRTWPLPHPARARCRPPVCRLRFGEGRRRPPPRTLTASWVSSLHLGPPKLPIFSRFNVLSFSGGTSNPASSLSTTRKLPLPLN
jgi:hypothetical protein